ncbi:MAG: ComF family protein [Gaiellaceae bacterium]
MLELLLPQRCLGCGRSGAVLCDACIDALPRLAPPFCDRCGAPTAWPVRRCAECTGRRIAFASARAAVAYDERVRRIVAGWKENGLRRLARDTAALVAEVVARPDVDALTFVPPDRDRLLRRGHHPAARLARELGALWELPSRALLDRPRTSSRQRGASLADRRRNVRGAFHASGSPRSVVVVDDVYTSGATASAAASALRKAGAREVHIVTLARTLRLR